MVPTATAVSAQDENALAATVDETQHTNIHVAIEQELLTVDLRDAPLMDVLQAIAEMAPFRLTLRGDLSTPVSWSFTDVPLDKGIKRLVGDNSLVMIYAPASKATTRLLSEVWVQASEQDVAAIEANPVEKPLDTVYRDGDGLEGVARLHTARQLARRRDEAATDALVSLLSQDEDRVIRRIAAGGLGKIGGERAVAALTSALVDEDSSVQRRAIFELGKIGGDDAAKALATVLWDDPDAHIREFAARALGQLDSMEARSALEVALSDPENTVREAAVGALAEWKSSNPDND